METSKRLRAVARGNVSAYMLYADEFALVFSYAIDASNIGVALDEVLSASREPFSAGGRDITGSWSTGIVQTQEQGTTAEVLDSNAETAVYLGGPRQQP